MTPKSSRTGSKRGQYKKAKTGATALMNGGLPEEEQYTDADWAPFAP